jgi:uncharacterized protein
MRHRPAMFALLLVMTLISGWGFVGAHEPGEEWASSSSAEEDSIFEEMLAEFGMDQSECLLVIEGDDLLGPEQVAISRNTVAAFEALDVVKRVLWVDDIPRFVGGPVPLPLLPASSSGPAAFRRAREHVLAHPLVAGHLLAPDESLWVLPIEFDHETLDARFERGEDFDPLQELEVALAGIKLSSAMRVSLTGSWPLSAAGEAAFEREQWLFHGLAYLLTFIFAAWLFRSFWAVILTGGGPILGVLWTFGILRLLGEEVNGLTRVILPVMIMMIGFTDSVHLMIHVRRERSRGLSPFESADSAVRSLMLPCWLTSFTTAIGFASLLLAKTELIQKFGLASLLGSLCTFFAVVTFLPLFASTRLGKNLVERSSSPVVDGALPLATGWVPVLLRRAKSIAVLGVGLTVLCLSVGVFVETDNRVLADIPESSAAARALRRIDDGLGGTVPISVLVEWDEARSGDWPAIVEAVSAARARLAAEPQFSEPLALTDLLAALPPGEDDSLAARVDWLSLAPQEVRDLLVLPDRKLARVEALLPDLGFEHFRGTFEQLEVDLERLGTAHPSFSFHLAGQAVVSGRLFGEVTSDLIQSLALASITIFFVLAFAFHSLRLGLISVVPNVFPLAATAALWVAMDMPMAGATAFVMSLGIAVDDTIHLIARFRRELEEGRELDDAVRHSVLGVGKALMITTSVLVLGFAPVLTSVFPRNRVFAGMICVTIASALIGDLLILPAMLKVFGERRSFLRRVQ